MKIDINEYRKWVAEQVCCDCGKPTREATDEYPFVTETQCMACWKQLGASENRNKQSAKQAFDNRHAI